MNSMWLVMHFDTSRNISFDAVAAGKYSNIRMHTQAHNNQPDGAMTSKNASERFDFFTAPPPPPYGNFGGYPEGGWMLPSVGQYANKTYDNHLRIPAVDSLSNLCC